MRKLTSLLLLFLCGMVTSWADYSVGQLLTADEVNAGVNQVCLYINQDQGIHFYITGEGHGTDDFVTTDKTNVFDFVKVSGGVVLRNSNGQYVCNNSKALAWSENIDDAAVFTAMQREDGVGNVVAPSSETIALIVDAEAGTRLNSIDISGNRAASVKYNEGTGVWTCFRVYKVDSDEAEAETGSFQYLVDQGTLTSSSAGSSFYWIYRSTQTDPSFVLRTNNSEGATVENVGPNNFNASGNALGLFPGGSGCYYYLDAQDGYAITGWHITATATEAKTITFNGTEYAFEDGVEKTLDFPLDEKAGTVCFRLTGSNKALVSNITVDWVKLNASNVTYVVYDEGGNELYRQTTAVEVGTEVSELPAAALRGYTEYEFTPFTVGNEDVTVTATAKFNLPFVTSSVENPKWYYIRQNDGTYVTALSSYVNFTEKSEENLKQHWAFFGNPYTGIQVYNEGASLYVAGNGGSYATLQADPVAWDVNANGEGFTLFKGTTQTWTTYSNYLYIWNWAGNQSIDIGRFFVEEVPVAEPAETFTEGYFNLLNEATQKVLGMDEFNMNTVDAPTEFTEIATGITSRDDGTFTVNLPVVHGTYNQHYMHIGSNARWSNGDATAITFYQVEDPAAETTVAKKVESLTLGATYLMVATREGATYALTNALYNEGDATNQRMESAAVTVVEDVITLDRNAAVLWTVGAFKETTDVKDITEGNLTFRNNADNKFLAATSANPQPTTASFEDLVATMAESAKKQITSYVTSADGTFHIQIVGSSRYAYCGSNGRFSGNTAANDLQLFKVADPTADTYQAAKVSEFEAGEAKYLIVGTKSGATYALTSNIYSEGTDNQRMEGTAVTIEENAISVAADKALLWSFAQANAELPAYEAVFEPEVETPQPEPGIQGTFRPTTRDAELVAGKEYMIYNAAVASGNNCWGFLHATEEGLSISGGTAPTEFTTDNKNYLFKLTENGDNTYTITNVGTGAVVGTSYSITKWEESSDIRGGGAALREDDGNVVPNGDFTGANVFVVTDNNASDASKPRWNGSFWTEVGDEMELLMFGKGHPYAFYVPEEVAEVKNVEVTFYVYDEAEKEVAKFTAEVAEGTVVETLPEEFAQEFCTYNVVEPVTVSEEDNEVLFEVSYNLPFIEGQEYLLKVNGKYVQFDENRSQNYCAVNTDAEYNTTPVTLEEILASETPALFYWTISGNPFDGYKLFNVGKQQYLTVANNGYTAVGEEGAQLGLATRGDGYTFTCEKGTLEDFYGFFAAIANESQITDELAVVKFEEVPENLATFEKAINLSTGEFTIANPTKTWASKWESTDGTPAITLTTNGNQMASNTDGAVLPNEGLKIYTAAGGNQLYTIDVETGYAITGYTIRGNAYSTDVTATDVTTGDQLTFTNAAEVQTFTVTLPEPAASAGFRIGNTSNVFLNAVITVNIQQLPTEDVTFSIYDEEDNHVYTEVLPVLRGETVTELPASMKRDFCTYEYPATLEVTKGGHNVFLTTVKMEMPFVADGKTPYNIKASNAAYLYVSEGAVSTKETLSDEDKADPAYAWTFTGNPYTGIAVQNVTGQYLANTEIPDGYWATAISLSDEAEYATLAANGEGFQLHFGIQNFIAVREGVASVYGYLAAAGTESTRLVVEEANVEMPEPKEVEVTVNVVDNSNNVLETLTVTALTGATLNEVPEDVTRLPFCEYAVNTPLNVTEGENVLTVNVTFQDAPFVTKDGEDAKWFNITTGRSLLVAGNNNVVSASNTDANKVQDNAQWAVYGNPYAYKFFNKAQQKYLTGEEPAADGATVAEFSDEAKTVMLAEEEDGAYMFYGLYYDSESGNLVYLGEGYASILIGSPMKFAAAPEGQVEEDNYPINFDKDANIRHASRWISNVQLDDQEIAVADSYSTQNKAYNNLTEEGGFVVTPGASAKPAIGYMAEWMHMYAYVDFDRDGQFKVEASEIVNGAIPEGQEIVSFSYFSGYNSAGEAVSDGNKTFDMPAFTVPADLTPGFYCMRYKVDWDDVTPGGKVVSSNHILNNGGSITDVRLNVHNDMVNLTAEAAENGTVTYEGATLSEAVQIPFGLETGVKFVPANGYMLKSLKVRHGYSDGAEYIHGIRQYAEVEVDLNEIVRNNYFIPGELIDGDVVIIPFFDVDSGIRDILNGADVESAYSIDGRRLNDRNILNKGVYVINGKKVLVK